MTRQVPWPRILIEGVVIVASILLAFGIQAWWERLGDAQQREAILAGLASDFALAATDLERVMEAQRFSYAATEKLVQLTSGRDVSPDRGSQIDSLLTEAFAAQPSTHPSEPSRRCSAPVRWTYSMMAHSWLS